MTPPCPSIAGMATRHTGLFVAFEGGDGAGKSTQVRLLADALRRAGLDVLETRQPGGTALGAILRDLVLHGDHVSPRAEALLYAADKAHRVERDRPALAQQRVVITDRYVDSAIAYQGAGRDLGSDEVAKIQRWAVDGLVPDLTVVLDVTPGPAGLAVATSTTGSSARATRSTRRPGSTSSRWPQRTPTATSSSTPPSRRTEIHTLVLARLHRRHPRGGGVVTVWDDVVGQPEAWPSWPRRSPTRRP